ncbi:MAG: YbhB/YbcL family Raf kinase inhibitor-like protein [Methanocorpusculum sp.]|nr:YbhB/YbcL family Raf kinase inhibitor-like protein [Methanocorpusculum sp.]
MDTITIDLGNVGLTPSSTFSGGNISPKINLFGVPKDMQYVSLVVINKSGEEKSKCIWTIWNIPSVGHVPPGFDEGPAPKFPFPAVQGLNDFGEHKWHGPNPGLGVRDKLLFQVFGHDDRIVISPDSKMDDLIKAVREKEIRAFGTLEVFYLG